MKFSFRLEDLEVRSCGEHLLSGGNHDRAEIVKWDKNTNGEEYCFAVAYWDKTKDGYNLKFVGKRPFSINNKDNFWKLAQQGQVLLEEEFNAQST